MLSFALTAPETRILGCLLEKERLTPENYPLSLNSLAAACNQATNREPVTSYDEKTVETAVNLLREKKLASVIFGAGSRVQKYRHRLPDHFNLEAPDVAILCGLLLRGPQTAGELRSRAERMHRFADLEEVEQCVAGLAAGGAPLVRALPPRPGQKERRFQQLFSLEAALNPESDPFGAAASPTALPLAAAVFTPAAAPDEGLAGLRGELSILRQELEQLRNEFAAFRRQFE